MNSQKRNTLVVGFSLLAVGIGAYFAFFRKKNTTMSNTTTSTTTNRPTTSGSTLPRGYRNNNPLNIRYTTYNNWKGKVLVNTDGAFEQFTSMAYGFRAAFVLIRNYVNNYGCDTLKKIIYKWAPENENNSAGYVNTVCKISGLSATQSIVPYNESQMKHLVYAMAYVENGIYPQWQDINEGWDLYIK